MISLKKFEKSQGQPLPYPLPRAALATPDENILLGGTISATASAASVACGVTREYVSRLCREGKCEAKFVGGQWFVEIASLREHLASQKVALEEKHRAHARFLREEYRSYAPKKPRLLARLRTSAAARLFVPRAALGILSIASRTLLLFVSLTIATSIIDRKST